MGEIVNLRRQRRRRERDAAAQAAADNRARHARTPTERARDALEAARRIAVLDGARIGPDPDPDEAIERSDQPPGTRPGRVPPAP